MKLLLRPRGRGNWAALSVEITGKRVTPMLVFPGQLVTLGGIVFRIAKVIA